MRVFQNFDSNSAHYSSSSEVFPIDKRAMISAKAGHPENRASPRY